MTAPLAGRANPQSTESYCRARGRSLAPSGGVRLGRTGLRVSGVGFGGYRVHDSVEEHRAALRRALLGGVNPIDVSANYGDGGAERLVGRVMAELIGAGELRREEIVVVTKGGYIQGQNMAVAQDRKQAGNPFHDVVRVSPDCWHCIHPEFLADQIARSLARLGLETVDVYLLHNPEYFLTKAHQAREPLDRALAEYERRIEAAFAHLKKEVAAGRIGAFGISSNSFPNAADDPEFTSLERCRAIAERVGAANEFAVAQMPINLVECGAFTQLNQAGGVRTVLEEAALGDLGVLVNRPLNAIQAGRLIRLADPPADLESRRESIARAIDEIESLERERDEIYRGERGERLSVARAFRPVLENPPGESQIDAWVRGELLPRFENVNDWVGREREPGESGVPWLTRYAGRINQTLNALHDYVLSSHRRRMDEIHAALEGVTPPAMSNAPLSQKAVWTLRSMPGVACVLLGMRRDAYVDDALAAAAVEPAALDRAKVGPKLESLASGVKTS
jgi:hypothetical protein